MSNLVLTRKVGESVEIFVQGAVIKVSVSSVHDKHTRLHFAAPRDVRILRSELTANGKKSKAIESETGTSPE